MPDVREVFQMSTQKVKPDPGFVDRQRDHQNKHERNRKVGAFVVVAAIGLAALVVILATRPEGNRTKPADTPSSPAPIFVPFERPFLLDLGTGTETPLSEDIWGVFYTASPDGSQLVYGHCCTGNDMVTVANIDGTGAHVITPARLDGYGPAWSPDGTELVYQLRDSATMKFGSLVVEDVATGEKTKLATIAGSDPWWFMSPSFSPDGRTVLFHVRASSGTWDVWSVPVSGGEPTQVLTHAGFARYFPDGKEIAFVSGMTSDLQSGRAISIANTDGSRRTLVRADIGIFRPTISPDGTRIAYQDGVSIYVVDVATGEATEVAQGGSADWLDDDTLIVSP